MKFVNSSLQFSIFLWKLYTRLCNNFVLLLEAYSMVFFVYCSFLLWYSWSTLHCTTTYNHHFLTSIFILNRHLFLLSKQAKDCIWNKVKNNVVKRFTHDDVFGLYVLWIPNTSNHSDRLFRYLQKKPFLTIIKLVCHWVKCISLTYVCLQSDGIVVKYLWYRICHLYWEIICTPIE